MAVNSKVPQRIIGWRYVVGLHFVLCLGGEDYSGYATGRVRLHLIRVGGKEVFSSGPGLHGTTNEYVMAPHVFGGDSREGGIGGFLTTNNKMLTRDEFMRNRGAQGRNLGNVTFWDGGNWQGRDDYLTIKTGTYHPAYRGLATITFKHFYIGMAPYLRPFWFQLSRRPMEGWWNGWANHFPWNGEAGAAQIILDVITSKQGGMGYPLWLVNEGSFQVAANTLWNEGFGLNLVWEDQMTCEQFIQHVLDHINGILRLDADGKYELKLLRRDYERASLGILDENNILEIKEFERISWGETINEVSVVFNGYNGRPITVTMQNTANIAIQGAVVSTTRRYPGISNAYIASVVAKRDVALLSAPLARLQLTTNRRMHRLREGDVIRVQYPPLGLQDVVFRVLKVDRGTHVSGAITFTMVEDYFGIQYSDVVDPPTDRPGIDPPVRQPIRKAKVAPLAYAQVAQSRGDESAAQLTEEVTYLGASALRQNGVTMAFDLSTAPVGETEFTSKATAAFGVGFQLDIPLAVEEETHIPAGHWSDNADPELIAVGAVGYVEDELVCVKEINPETGETTLARGILDTTPAAHPAYEWCILHGLAGPAANAVDPVELGEEIQVKLPVSGAGGIDDLELVTAEAYSEDRPRHLLPIAPGRFRINGSRTPPFLTGNLSFDWVHRNRLMQTGAVVLEQDDPGIDPEPGVSYELELRDQNGTVFLTKTTTGTAATVTMDEERAARGSLASQLDIRLRAVRGAYKSWQDQAWVAARAAFMQDCRPNNWFAVQGYAREAETGYLLLGNPEVSWADVPSTWSKWGRWGVYRPPSEWSQIAAWDEWIRWGEPGYTAPHIDTGQVRSWYIDTTCDVLDATESYPQVRYASAPGAWSAWISPPQVVIARYIQVRAIVFGESPKLRDLITRIL